MRNEKAKLRKWRFDKPGQVAEKNGAKSCEVSERPEVQGVPKWWPYNEITDFSAIDFSHHLAQTHLCVKTRRTKHVRNGNSRKKGLQ